MQIEGSVALVTGANRGIGAGVAAALLDAGAAKVYAGSRDPSAITDPRLQPIALDITDAAQVAAAAAQASDVRILVNNAGIGTGTSPLDGDDELAAARLELEVNYLGHLRMSRAFAPVLAANGGGALVNVLSALSWVAFPHLGTYSAAKSAAWSMTNSLRLLLREQGTLVSGLHVGYVDTDLTAAVTDPKVPVSQVVDALVAGLLAGDEEILADETSRQVKSALSGDLALLYGARVAA